MLLEWQENQITRLLKEVIEERIDEAKEKLVNSSDPEFDRVVKGMVLAFREVLDWEPQVEEDEDVS